MVENLYGFELLYQNTDTSIVYCPTSSANPKHIIVFTFTPSRPSTTEPHPLSGFRGKALLEAGFDVVAIKTTPNNWFQTIPPEAFTKIKKFTQKKDKYKIRAAYGSSMGGYGAVQFAKILELDIVLAFSPQFTINQDYDKRWQKEASQIQFKYLFTEESVRTQCAYHLAYDPKGDDLQHIIRFRSVLGSSLIEHPVPYTGHITITALHEARMLDDFSFCTLAGEGPASLDKKQVRQSPTYRKELLLALAKKKHFPTALALIEQSRKSIPATEKNKDFFEWLLSKEAEFLAASGKLEKAIIHLEKCILGQQLSDKTSLAMWLQLGELYLKIKNFSAATLCAYHNIRNPTKNTSDFHILLWKTLEAQGLRTQAKNLIVQQIIKDPQNHAMHAFFSGLLLRDGEPDAALKEIDLAIQLEPNTPWFKSHRSNIIAQISSATGKPSTQL